MEAVLQRLEKIATRMEKLTLSMKTEDINLNTDDSDTNLDDFDNDVISALPDFVESANAFESCLDLGKLAASVDIVFRKTRIILEQFSHFQKPESKTAENECLTEFGKILTKELNNIETIYSTLRRDDAFINHVSAISQSIIAICWFTCEEPVTYIQEMVRACEFFTNRIVNRYKTDKIHMQFVKTYLNLLNKLLEYVRLHYPSGPSWSYQTSLSHCTASALASALATSNPAPSLKAETNKVVNSIKDDPKTKSGKSWSDDSLKKQQTSSGDIKKTTNPKKSSAKKPDRKPDINYVGQRWMVENGHGQSEITVKVEEMKQSVYILNCSHSVIKITGPKVNSVILDSCAKVELLIECAVLSRLECVNSKSIRVQSMDSLQTASVDITEGFQLFLSTKSSCNLYSSLSSEVTIYIKDPKTNEFIENPVPNQFVTEYNNESNTLLTTVATNLCGDS
ncbi:hypothetical protein GJ496_002207 [Pomphorhynchus laevis]|nr:hypothetical protein GJ496_002207 [Pomphorhynchus laevis]